MTEVISLFKTLHPIVLLLGGSLGLMCFLTGLAMIYEPLWLIVGGALLLVVCGLLAYEKGERS